MPIDERALGGLIEQSQDVHSDAMNATTGPLSELVEFGHETRARGGHDPDEVRDFSEHRRRLLGKGLFGAGSLATAGIGAAVLALMESPAFAAQAPDVQMLQTAASIENLAVAAYAKVLTLPLAGQLPPTVQTFVMTTKDQHTEHAAAFNGAAKQLGGKEQTQPDPALLATVNNADLSAPGPVVDLALELENTAAQTYVANTAALKDPSAKKVTASIMGVEAQHAAILNAVKALLGADLASQIALPPPDLAALPAAAGSVGFPDAFFKTDMARAAEEGAVR